MKPVLWMDYLVIICFMALSLGVGFYFMRFNKGAADFFKGGNKIPWLISGLSAFMTGFSAWRIVNRQPSCIPQHIDWTLPGEFPSYDPVLQRVRAETATGAAMDPPG